MVTSEVTAPESRDREFRAVLGQLMTCGPMVTVLSVSIIPHITRCPCVEVPSALT